MKKRIDIITSFLVIFASLAILLALTPADTEITGYQAYEGRCKSGEFRCNDKSTALQKCRNGVWINEKECQGGCNNAHCITRPECRENTLKCSDNNVVECRGGMWVTKRACKEGCKLGECANMFKCESGDFTCSAEGNMLFYCKRGEWYIKERCKCENNACVEALKNMVCTDTDSGKNYEMIGKAAGINEHGLKYEYNDACIGTKLLSEYYCEGNWAKKEDTECTGRCIMGACEKIGQAEEIGEAPALPNVPEEQIPPPVEGENMPGDITDSDEPQYEISYVGEVEEAAPEEPNAPIV